MLNNLTLLLMVVMGLRVVLTLTSSPQCYQKFKIKHIENKSYGQFIFDIKPGASKIYIKIGIATNTTMNKKNKYLSTLEGDEQIIEAMKFGGKITFLKKFNHEPSLFVSYINYNGNQLCENVQDISPTFSLIYNAKLNKDTLEIDQGSKHNYRQKRQTIECGKRKEENEYSRKKRDKQLNPLIQEGSNSDIGKWPWMVYLMRKINGRYKFFCGGTIVETDMILTAAHCVVKSRSMGKFIFRKGIDDIIAIYGFTEPTDTDESMSKVIKVYVHPNYYTKTLSNDIAILHVTRIKYSPTVQPVCLSTSDINNRLKGVVTGWGSDGVQSSTKQLKEANVKVISKNACKRNNKLSRFFSEKNFCIDGIDGTPCNGDSGSGLYTVKNGAYSLRGVVSLNFGDTRCPRHGTSDSYTLFTHVGMYINWITNVEKEILKQ